MIYHVAADVVKEHVMLKLEGIDHGSGRLSTLIIPARGRGSPRRPTAPGRSGRLPSSRPTAIDCSAVHLPPDHGPRGRSRGRRTERFTLRQHTVSRGHWFCEASHNCAALTKVEALPRRPDIRTARPIRIHGTQE